MRIPDCALSFRNVPSALKGLGKRPGYGFENPGAISTRGTVKGCVTGVNMILPVFVTNCPGRKTTGSGDSPPRRGGAVGDGVVSGADTGSGVGSGAGSDNVIAGGGDGAAFSTNPRTASD